MEIERTLYSTQNYINTWSIISIELHRTLITIAICEMSISALSEREARV